MRSRVWEIQSQCVHDGKDIWTPDIVERFVEELKQDRGTHRKSNLIHYAWCLHDKDTYGEIEFADPFIPGVPQHVDKDAHKPDHIHLAVQFENAVSNVSLAKRANLPIGCIRKPEAIYNQFMAITTYLTHMRAEEQAKGKHRYDDDEVHCDFNYKEAVDKYLVDKDKYQRLKNRSPRAIADKMINDLEAGEIDLEGAKRRAKTISGYALFLRYEKEFRQARMEYIKRGYQMRPRINIYIYGAAGTGKSTLSQRLARALFPQYEDYECYFTVGAAGVRFDDYEYQPVIIWEDVRGEELLKEYKREGILNLMEPNPKKRSYSIKFGKVTLTHQVNIFTGPEEDTKFVAALMAEYKDGGQVIAEDKDKEQLLRRLPIVIRLTRNELSVFSNSRIFANPPTQTSEYSVYAQLTNCNIADLNRFFASDALDEAFASITEPIVELRDEYMKRVEADIKILDADEAPRSICIYRGEDAKNMEKVKRKAYQNVCEDMLAAHIIEAIFIWESSDENDEDIGFSEDDAFNNSPRENIKEVIMYGPYKPDSKWTLGDVIKDGPFKGVYCPITYQQWLNMLQPGKYETYHGFCGIGYESDLERAEEIHAGKEESKRIEKLTPRKAEIREYLFAEQRKENPKLPEGLTEDDIRFFKEQMPPEEYAEVYGENESEGNDVEMTDVPQELVAEYTEELRKETDEFCMSPNQEWVAKYTRKLRKATDEFCMSPNQEQLAKWVKLLFGEHEFQEIDGNETAKDCLHECWRTVRKTCLQSGMFKNEVEWYTAYQRIIQKG